MKLLLILLFSGTIMLSPSLAENLAPFGTMEAGQNNVPEGWSLLSGEVHLGWDEHYAAEGNASLEITVSGEEGHSWVRSATIAVRPNTTYHLSLQVSAVEGQPVPFYGVRVYESDGGWNPPDGTSYPIEREPGDSRSGWVTKETTFTTREGTRWLYIGIFINGKIAGSLRVDEVALKEAHPH